MGQSLLLHSASRNPSRYLNKGKPYGTIANDARMTLAQHTKQPRQVGMMDGFLKDNGCHDE